MKALSEDDLYYRQLMFEETRQLDRIPSQKGGIGRYMDPDKVASFSLSYSQPELSAVTSSSKTKQRRVRFLSDEGLQTLTAEEDLPIENLSQKFEDGDSKSSQGSPTPVFPASLSFSEDMPEVYLDKKETWSIGSQEFVFQAVQEAEDDGSVSLFTKRTNMAAIQLKLENAKGDANYLNGIGKFGSPVEEQNPKSPYFQPAAKLFGPLVDPHYKDEPVSKPKERKRVQFNEENDVSDPPMISPSPVAASPVHPKSALRKVPMNSQPLGYPQEENGHHNDGYFSDGAQFPHGSSLKEPTCGCTGPRKQKVKAKSSRLPQFGAWDGNAEKIADKFEKMALERKVKKGSGDGKIKNGKSSRWVAEASRRIFGMFEEVGKSFRVKSRARTFRSSKSARSMASSARSSYYLGSPLRWNSDDDDEPDWLKEFKKETIKENKGITRSCFGPSRGKMSP